jgi:hypothetical protein
MFTSPFEPLIHNWELLQDLSIETPTDEEDKLDREYLKYVLHEVQSDMKQYFAERETNITDKLISYDYLWTVFSPGTIVLTNMKEQQYALLVSSTTYYTPSRKEDANSEADSDSDVDEQALAKRNKFILRCWTYGNFYIASLLIGRG